MGAARLQPRIARLGAVGYGGVVVLHVMHHRLASHAREGRRLLRVVVALARLRLLARRLRARCALRAAGLERRSDLGCGSAPRLACR